MIGQSWVGANATSEETLCRSEPMIRMQQEMEVKESSWEKVIPKRPQQEKCEDRTEMQKESKIVRCILLTVSA